jgi:hypothetical protein
MALTATAARAQQAQQDTTHRRHQSGGDVGKAMRTTHHNLSKAGDKAEDAAHHLAKETSKAYHRGTKEAKKGAKKASKHLKSNANKVGKALTGKPETTRKSP